MDSITLISIRPVQAAVCRGHLKEQKSVHGVLTPPGQMGQEDGSGFRPQVIHSQSQTPCSEPCHLGEEPTHGPRPRRARQGGSRQHLAFQCLVTGNASDPRAILLNPGVTLLPQGNPSNSREIGEASCSCSSISLSAPGGRGTGGSRSSMVTLKVIHGDCPGLTVNDPQLYQRRAFGECWNVTFSEGELGGQCTMTPVL